jgi:hypothetical protein
VHDSYELQDQIGKGGAQQSSSMVYNVFRYALLLGEAVLPAAALQHI